MHGKGVESLPHGVVYYRRKEGCSLSLYGLQCIEIFAVKFHLIKKGTPIDGVPLYVLG